MVDSSPAAKRARQGKRVLLFGWGAAAEAVLVEVHAFTADGAGVAEVQCLSHLDQASDCDLRDVCRRLGFACSLHGKRTEMVAAAKAFAPDLIISASYRLKIPSEVLELCQDAVNFHPSLLPRHRGCWSGFWAIFDGDAETGVTCHRMVEEFDEGLILHQERLNISKEDTAFSLYKALVPVTGVCARRMLSMCFDKGLPEGMEQEGPASYNKRHLPYDGLIQRDWSDDQVSRFIQAMVFPPHDGAALLIGDRRVLINSLAEYHAAFREVGEPASKDSGMTKTKAYVIDGSAASSAVTAALMASAPAAA